MNRAFFHWKVGAETPFKRALLAGMLWGLFSCGGENSTECPRSRDLQPCRKGWGVCLLGTCTEHAACTGDCDANWYFPLPDTGLLKCYGPSGPGEDGTIACPAMDDCAGTDYCGQDAQYGWDIHHAPAERYTVEGAIVHDRVTGLAWQRCSMGQSGPDCQGEAVMMDWYEAVQACEELVIDGISDWVLPDRHALQSSVDYSRTTPAFRPDVFVNSPTRFFEIYESWWSECYWSSTDYARDANVAWVLLSNSGDVGSGSGTPYHSNDKGAEDWEGCYVRCIRRPSVARDRKRFVLSGDGTQVGDTVTGLVWQRCSAGQTGPDCQGEAVMMDWKEALATCEGQKTGGSSSWRLPSIMEISSLIDSSRAFPAIDTEVFPRTPFYGGSSTHNNAGHYWSSTARWYNSFALYADFTFGFTHFYVQDEGRHVRCVRGGFNDSGK